MTPIIITLSLLISSKQGRINSGTDLGTGYGGTVCGFHTRPTKHTYMYFTSRNQCDSSFLTSSFSLNPKRLRGNLMGISQQEKNTLSHSYRRNPRGSAAADIT